MSFLRYASLYFCCAVEQTDNELVTLEIIHRYVELLDKYFGSVSSLFTHYSKGQIFVQKFNFYKTVQFSREIKVVNN